MFMIVLLWGDVTWSEPLWDNGLFVDKYRIEWFTEELRGEEQIITSAATSDSEMQRLWTCTDKSSTDTEIQIIRVASDSVGSVDEVQTIKCLADSGCFIITFDSYTTACLEYDADEFEVKTAITNLDSINDTDVLFSGATACSDDIDNPLTIAVTFIDVVNYGGDVPLIS